MHILHTVLYTFPNVLSRIICSTLIGDPFLYFRDLNFVSGLVGVGGDKTDAGHP